MKYYEFFSNGGGIIGESKDLSMDITGGAGGEVAVFGGIPHSKIAFHTDKIYPSEPIKLEAHYYNEGEKVIEIDLTNAGSPQVVSEDFKKLVEELDPNCAQFFNTEGTNYKPNKKYFVMHITKLVEKGDVTENDHVFRVKSDVLFHMVSEKFYKAFKKRKLKGVAFTEHTRYMTNCWD